MGSGSRRALVIEDEPEIARLLQWHLEDIGCTVERCHDGHSGLKRALDGTAWKLLVLDLRLPGIDGIEICRRVRASSSYSPILMVTACASEADRVRGLDTGADDYLTKPFSVAEFTARARAILRRVEQLAHHAPTAARLLRIEDLEINLEQRQVKRGDTALDLTAREFDLLAHLVKHPSRVFTRAQLLDQVWGTTHDAFEHTVNSHINRLRGKIESDPERPRYIETVWGVGYRLAAPTARTAQA